MKFKGVFKELQEKKFTTADGEEKSKYILVMEDMGSAYTSNVTFEIFGEQRIKELVTEKTYEAGEVYDVSFNLRSNYSEKTQTWYPSVSAWSIRKEKTEPIDA